jgi:hypothetical protein
MQSFSANNSSSGKYDRHPLPNRIRIHLFCATLLLFSALNASTDTLQVPQQNSGISDQVVTYVVKEGDTFWDLAFEFTGDPFEWPFLWKGNPHIKNPHLIYPGDQLLISGTSEKDSTTNDSSGKTIRKQASLVHPLTEASSGVKGKFLLSSHFFSSVPFLWTKKDSSGNMYPGNAVVEKPYRKGSYQLFDIISIRPGKGVAFVPGDTIDLFASIRFVRFKGTIANLVKKNGKAVVEKVEDRKILARLIEMSEVISGGERAEKSANTALKGVYEFSQPENPVAAEVFERVETTASPFLFQTLIIDKGENEGIRVGDVFAVYHKEKGIGVRYCMTGYAAHVNSRTSSLIIVSISSNTVFSGDSAALILRSKPAQ